MQTCSRCNTNAPDSVNFCPRCEADLRELSYTAVALKRIRLNPRVRNVRLAVPKDACPACLAMEGTYEKDKAPTLPIEGCSEPNGCRAFYEPLLEEIYP